MFDKFLNNLVYIKVDATGWYSGNSASEGMFMPKDLFAEYVTDRFNIGFCELDGKHSYVDADVEFILVDSVSVMEACLIHMEKGFGERDRILDAIFDNTETPREELSKLNELNDMFIKKTSTNVVFEFEGQQLTDMTEEEWNNVTKYL